MAYLTQQQLETIPFKHLGKNVKISDTAKIYNADQMSIGDNSRIDDFCVLSGKIILGAYVHIAPLCLIASCDQAVSIGDFTGLAYGSRVFSKTDDYSGEFMVSPLVPVHYTNPTMSEVNIDRHVIIGTNSVILPGLHIAEGCSIGALSLVTRSTESWGIYVGIPAKRIKEKHRNILQLEKQFLKQEGST